MAKGSGFTRTVQYFRSAGITEAKACLDSCIQIVNEREVGTAPPLKRKRRTKAELTAARAFEQRDGSEYSHEKGANA